MNSRKNKLNSKINWFFNLKPKSAVGPMNSKKNKLNSKISRRIAYFLLTYFTI